MQTLCSLLPGDLRERITSQLTANSMTYPTMREFALAQVARRTADATRRRLPEPTPMEVDLAEYEDAKSMLPAFGQHQRAGGHSSRGEKEKERAAVKAKRARAALKRVVAKPQTRR